ncbi:MAG TPA: hypothetical protein VGL38_06660 [bacterium]|jgi:hypothetical protein
MPETIPPGLRAIYDAAGPVIRYRLVRDILGRDDTFIQTMHLGLEIPRLAEPQTLLSAQQLDGSWNGVLCATTAADQLTTERAFLRLCELGMEKSEAVGACLEKALMPTLFSRDVLWEFHTHDEAAHRAARQVVRDKALFMVCRATRETDEVIKPMLELVLAEWEQYVVRPREAVAAPTIDAYAAICWFPWSDDDFDRVQKIVVRMVKHAEGQMGGIPAVHPLLLPHLFQLSDKWEYLARPQDLLFELELSARLGITRDLDVTRWLLEELEARQDADGWFRFETGGDVEASWYFPLETSRIDDFPVEWTFRGDLIFKLLEYDI